MLMLFNNRDYEKKKRIKRRMNSFVLFCWWEPRQGVGQYTKCNLWDFGTGVSCGPFFCAESLPKVIFTV